MASAIYTGSEFNSATDTLLVVNNGDSIYATRGKIEYPATLASFFVTNALSNPALGIPSKPSLFG